MSVPSSGYGGRGYKFDEAEEQKKKEELKMQKKALGIDDGSDEEEEESEGAKSPAFFGNSDKCDVVQLTCLLQKNWWRTRASRGCTKRLRRRRRR